MGTNEMIGAVISTLVVLIGLVSAIVTPLIKQVKVMTQLNESIKALTEKFNSFEVNNHDDHKRIWTHNDEQDGKINEHETRISILERSGSGGRN